MRRHHDPLFESEKRRHPVLGFIFLFICALLAGTLAFNHLNNNRVNLVRQNVTVPTLPSSLENFRILHISDLHGLFFGAEQERLAAAVSDAKYDIVCITGDVTDKNGSPDAFLKLISLFQSKVPVYFITGDEDPDPILSSPHNTDSAKADYILAAEAIGAIYLDAPQKITRGNGTIWLSPEWVYSLDAENDKAALDSRKDELEKEPDSPERNAALTAVNYQIDRLARIRAARSEVTANDIHIALTHHPLQMEALENLQEWSAGENDSYVRTVSLVLAGHYVSGQWMLPLLGPVKAPASAGLKNGGWFPKTNEISGLSYFLGVPQYISPGLGASAANGLPAFRLFNTPAVTQITLTTRLTD